MIHERLKEVRKHFGMTQKDFGREIGVSDAAVAHLESGRNNPSPQTIQLICSQFRVNSEWLKDGADVPMFLEEADEDEIILRFLQGEDPWKKKILLSLCKMPPECWDAVRSLARYYKSQQQNPPEKE